MDVDIIAKTPRKCWHVVKKQVIKFSWSRYQHRLSRAVSSSCLPTATKRQEGVGNKNRIGALLNIINNYGVQLLDVVAINTGHLPSGGALESVHVSEYFFLLCLRSDLRWYI